MNIFKRKHKHQWQYPERYADGATRVCKTCGETQVWHEVHYGTWEPAPAPPTPGNPAGETK